MKLIVPKGESPISELVVTPG